MRGSSSRRPRRRGSSSAATPGDKQHEASADARYGADEAMLLTPFLNTPASPARVAPVPLNPDNAQKPDGLPAWEDRRLFPCLGPA